MRNELFSEKGEYLHSNAAAFERWAALAGWVAAVNDGCVIAARAAKFCTVI